MATNQFASGRYAKVTALQQTYAKAPLDDTAKLIQPVMTQADDYQTFSSWEVNSTIEIYPRSNTLCRTKQYGIGLTEATVKLTGLINPYARMGYFLGQYVRIILHWYSPETNTDVYPIDLFCTITGINKNIDVSDAYRASIDAVVNYSFDFNDSNFVTLKSATNPSDRGFIPRAPDLTQNLWSI